MADDGPAYRRVLNDLRGMILSGELQPGDKLPSVRELKLRYGITQGTAARVIAELRAEGRVISHHGSGVVVRAYQEIRRSSPSRLAFQRWGSGAAIQDADTGDRQRSVDPTTGEEPGPDWVAAGFNIDPTEPIAYRRRRFLVDDRPVLAATSYIPTDLARGTQIMHTETGPGGIYARLAEVGHGPQLFNEELRCRMPLPQEIKELQLPDGTPVIEIVRRSYDQAGRCVEINHMILDATVYVLDYTFPAEPVPLPNSSK